jgi:hypothetical protein
VLNVIGEEFVNNELQQFIGEYTKQIDLTNNAKGIYFLEIETSGGVINKKLILQLKMYFFFINYFLKICLKLTPKVK